jgi:predicted aspartyl protease
MHTSEKALMGRETLDLSLANYRDLVDLQAGRLAPDQVRRARVAGIIDTGAARLVLPETVATRLGAPKMKETIVRYADGRTATRAMVNEVHLSLLGREGIFNAIVEPDRTEALVGAIVLEDLDLIVDCATQSVHPRDPDHIVSEVE